MCFFFNKMGKIPEHCTGGNINWVRKWVGCPEGGGCVYLAEWTRRSWGWICPDLGDGRSCSLLLSLDFSHSLSLTLPIFSVSDHFIRTRTYMCACLWSHPALCAISTFIPCLFAGPEAGRESVQTGERHPGGERECCSADSAPTGLWQHCRQPEQHWTHSGELWQMLVQQQVNADAFKSKISCNHSSL